MTGRKCSSCKHYEPAPIWRKGWCRNPLLYSPQQSHLVGEDDLDCERGMGNYWEAGDPSQAFATVGAGFDIDSGGFRESVSDAFATVSATDDAAIVPPAALGPPRAYAVSGGSIGDPPGDEPPLTGGGGGRGGRDRQVSYYSDDRYWTDYLRIAAPILGVLLMVGLFWFWASSFLGDDNKDPNKGGVAGTTTTLPTIGATVNHGSPTAGAKGTPTLTIVQTPSSAAPTPTTAEAEVPAPTEDAGGTDVTPPGGEGVYAGATVKVAGTGGTGANLRSDSSADADVIAVELDGTELTTTGEAVVDADGLTWWPVTGDDGDGFIVADYLELVQ